MYKGSGVAYWSRRCAASRRVPGSIPLFLPTKPCVLIMSTRDLSWGKGGRCVWLTTYHSCSAESRDVPGP